MKTLQEIKDELALELGWKDWSNMIHLYDSINTSLADKLAKRYAEQALKEAAEKVKICIHGYDGHPSVDKDSILNLIKELK